MQEHILKLVFRRLALLAVALFRGLVFFIVTLVAMIAVGRLIISPAVNLFGKERVLLSLVFFSLGLLTLAYTILTRELWQRNPLPPPGTNRIRWLWTIYWACWQKGWSYTNIRLAYVALLVITTVGVAGGLLVYQQLETALVAVGSGMISPTLMITTVLQPLFGSPNRAEGATP